MRTLLLLSVVVSLLFQGALPPLPVAAQTPAGCQFILGFATVRDLIGAETVGDCLADQQFAPNGDAQQPTTGGLLVWRKADNWTAFTDGYWTWINGPYGVQQRLNTDRFTWEGALVAATATPVPPAPRPGTRPTASPTAVPAALTVLSQVVIRGQRSGRPVTWVTGELRNDGPDVAYGYSVKATFGDEWGNVVASAELDTGAARPPLVMALAPGEIVGYKAEVLPRAQPLPEYRQLDVRAQATARPPATSPSRSVPVAALRLRFEDKPPNGPTTAHAGGTVTNTTQRLFKNPSVVAWFLTDTGQVVDVAQATFGTTDVQLGAQVLRPGQAGTFDVAAPTCPTATTPMVGQCPAYNPLFAGIKSIKVLAFVKEEDLP